MPAYQLRFIVETCLRRSEDLSVRFGGHVATFLFSKKAAADKTVIALVETDALNNRGAHDQVASQLLPTILDALSFASGTPLLLKECELILKNEAGSVVRRAIFVGNRKYPSQVQITPEVIAEMQSVLERGEAVRLPLCWHRYALDRQLALEQFVFHWLAFEGLAGDADVASHCQVCQNVVEHCGSPVTHRSTNKAAAREIFLEANSDLAAADFNQKVWRKARNSVFHGGAYPEPGYLFELKALAERLHKSIDQEITSILRLDDRARAHQHYEQWYRHFLFVEWRTSNAAVPFAADWPADHLHSMAAEDAPGEAHYAAERAGINLLDYQRDSPGW